MCDGGRNTRSYWSNKCRKSTYRIVDNTWKSLNDGKQLRRSMYYFIIYSIRLPVLRNWEVLEDLQTWRPCSSRIQNDSKKEGRSLQLLRREPHRSLFGMKDGIVLIKLDINEIPVDTTANGQDSTHTLCTRRNKIVVLN